MRSKATYLKISPGNRNVAYDANNRPTLFTKEGGSVIVENGYDFMGRRYMQKVTENGTVTRHERYLYRGYLQIAALDILHEGKQMHALFWDPTEPLATRPLVLLASDDNRYTYAHDLTKNVTELLDAEGNIAAAYDYDPFGTVTATGPAAHLNPIQWSSEVYDAELGLVYYNYRHYNPADGRWINRDPIAERGGMNLYGFVRNNSNMYFDQLGREMHFIDAQRPGAAIYPIGIPFMGYHAYYYEVLNKLDISSKRETGCEVFHIITNIHKSYNFEDLSVTLDMIDLMMRTGLYKAVNININIHGQIAQPTKGVKVPTKNVYTRDLEPGWQHYIVSEGEAYYTKSIQQWISNRLRNTEVPHTIDFYSCFHTLKNQGESNEKYGETSSDYDLERLKNKLNHIAQQERKSKDCRRILVAVLNFERYGPAVEHAGEIKNTPPYPAFENPRIPLLNPAQL